MADLLSQSWSLKSPKPGTPTRSVAKCAGPLRFPAFPALVLHHVLKKSRGGAASGQPRRHLLPRRWQTFPAKSVPEPHRLDVRFPVLKQELVLFSFWKPRANGNDSLSFHLRFYEAPF